MGWAPGLRKEFGNWASGLREEVGSWAPGLRKEVGSWASGLREEEVVSWAPGLRKEEVVSWVPGLRKEGVGNWVPGLREEVGSWASGLRKEVSLWELQSTVRHPGSGEAQGSQTPAPGFTSLSRGWRRSLLQSWEGRRGPRHLTSWLLLPSPSWLRPGIPHHPQEFCTEPRFICEDMSRTDVCQGRLGEPSEPVLSPQIPQVAAGSCSRPPRPPPPHPTPPSALHLPLSLSSSCLLSTLP